MEILKQIYENLRRTDHVSELDYELENEETLKEKIRKIVVEKENQKKQQTNFLVKLMILEKLTNKKVETIVQTSQKLESFNEQFEHAREEYPEKQEQIDKLYIANTLQDCLFIFSEGGMSKEDFYKEMGLPHYLILNAPNFLEEEPGKLIQLC